MKFLMCGDIVGRSGREVAEKYVKTYREEVDFVVANVDNAAHGFGVVPKIANHFFEIGVDVLTGGNHLVDQKEIFPMLSSDKRLLKPANTSDKLPGRGVGEYSLRDGRKIVVVHLLGQKDMSMIGDNPFVYMEKFFLKYQLGVNVSAIIVDFHAEVSSEKLAMGHFLDGKVSVVFGTHIHIPTADYRILENGTAYQTDLGMCGDYNSVLGFQKSVSIERFLKGFGTGRLTPATGEGTFSGLLVEVDDKTGLALSVKHILQK